MSESRPDEAPLDNPIWNALRGPLARFASWDRERIAVRFDPEVSPFCAVERLDPRGWSGLADLVGPQGVAVVWGCGSVPGGWAELMRLPTYQMVVDAELPAPPPGPAPSRLGAADADDMLALTQLTEPGPFLARTHELGTYLGVRVDGALRAMAGQRLRVPGWIEVSAVCTHPEVRGKGLGAAMTLHVARHIRRAGAWPMLHVLVRNAPAIRLYEALGFRIRRQLDIVVAQCGAV